MNFGNSPRNHLVNTLAQGVQTRGSGHAQDTNQIIPKLNLINSVLISIDSSTTKNIFKKLYVGFNSVYSQIKVIGFWSTFPLVISIIMAVIAGLFITIITDADDYIENGLISLGVSYFLVFYAFPEYFNFTILDVLRCI